MAVPSERFCTKAGVKRRKRGKLVSINDYRKEVEQFFSEGIPKQGVSFKEWPNMANHFRLVKGNFSVPAHQCFDFSMFRFFDFSIFRFFDDKPAIEIYRRLAVNPH